MLTFKNEIMKYKEFKEQLNAIEEMNVGVDLNDFDVVFETKKRTIHDINKVKTYTKYASLTRCIKFTRYD